MHHPGPSRRFSHGRPHRISRNIHTLFLNIQVRSLLPGLVLLLFLMMKPAVSCYGQNPFTSTAEKSGAPATVLPEQEPVQGDVQGDLQGAEQGQGIRESKESREESKPAGTLLFRLTNWLRLLQRRFHSSLSEAMTGLKNDPNPGLLISLLAAAFMYGFVHALGPGHRKTVLAALFAGGRYGPKDALIAGMGFALLHGGSAIVLLLTIYAFVAGPLSAGMEITGAFLEKGSFFILALVGLWMIISAVREMAENKKTEKADRKKGRYAIPMVIAAGVVPCPGAALILSFAIVYQVLPLGIAAVIAMSVGMGTALFLIAAATGKAGRLIARIGNSAGRTEKIGQLLELAGGILITLFAISMFLLLP